MHMKQRINDHHESHNGSVQCYLQVSSGTLAYLDIMSKLPPILTKAPGNQRGSREAVHPNVGNEGPVAGRRVPQVRAAAGYPYLPWAAHAEL